MELAGSLAVQDVVPVVIPFFQMVGAVGKS